MNMHLISLRSKGFIFILASALILWSCGPATIETEPEPPSCEEIGSHTFIRGSVLLDSIENNYIADTVIVTGTASDLAIIVQDVLGIEDTEDEPRWLAEIPILSDPLKPTATGETTSDDNLVIRLYPTRESQDTTQQYSSPDAVAEIYQTAATRLSEGAISQPVFADLNYVTGFPILANPWSIVGSPWSIVGSQWISTAGSTDNDVGMQEAENAFWNQWAFSSTHGIGLIDQRGNRVVGDGTNYRIGIFDTSPFVFSGSVKEIAIQRTNLGFDLCVHHPRSSLGLSPATDEYDRLHINEHGLFVTGFIHAIAPQSDLHLYRVLGDDGIGDLVTTIAALQSFLDVSYKAYGKLDNTIINFSMGFHPEPTDIPDEYQTWLEAHLSELSAKQSELYERILTAEQGVLEAVALRVPIALATIDGALVVAASGNDSDQSTQPLQSQAPAKWPEVKGVGANNIHGDISCYSNEADVYAPGGDGFEPPNTCVPHLEDCAESGSMCNFGVISLVTNATSDYGFGFWVGTSFAAPLVSGMFAVGMSP